MRSFSGDGLSLSCKEVGFRPHSAGGVQLQVGVDLEGNCHLEEDPVHTVHGEQPGLVDPALLGAVSAGRRDVRAAGRQGGGGAWLVLQAAAQAPACPSCSAPLWSLRDSLRYLGDSLGKRGRHHPPVKPLEVLLERLLLRAVIWLSR